MLASLPAVVRITPAVASTKSGWKNKFTSVANLYEAQCRGELGDTRWFIHLLTDDGHLRCAHEIEEALNAMGLTSVSTVVCDRRWLAVQSDRDVMLLRLFGWDVYDWFLIRDEISATIVTH